MTRFRKRWPAIRATLLAAHVVAVLVLSLPSPTRLADRSRWASQRTQSELALWAKRLGWSNEVLEARLWAITQRYLRFRGALSAPFIPYARLAGTGQGWGMFRSPQRRPGVLLVEISEADGTWHPIYRSRSSEHTYLRTQLDHNRMRKLVARSARDGRLFASIADWIAREAAHDFPTASALRVRFERFHSLSPEQVRAGAVPSYQTARHKHFALSDLRETPP